MRFGIDMGGTKIEIIALDDDGNEKLRERIATDKESYDANVTNMAKLVKDAVSSVGEEGTVGIATPGSLSLETGLLQGSNATILNGKPIKEDLEAAMGQEIRIANDANCLALSEATDGAAAGMPIVFAVIIGSGVGGGLIVNGQIVTGANSITGEWGHNSLPEATEREIKGRECHCGRPQCIEQWLSGNSFTSTFQGDVEGVDDEDLHAKLIVEAMRAGDDDAKVHFEKYVDRAARAFGSIINMLDPHAIVLGGGMSNVDELYEAVPAVWNKYVFSEHVYTKLLKSKFGDSSGVRGAAWLWPKD